MHSVGWWSLPLAPRTASILILSLWGHLVITITITTTTTTTTAAALSNAAKLCASAAPSVVDLGSQPFPTTTKTTTKTTLTPTTTPTTPTATTTATTTTATTTRRKMVVTWLVDGNNLSCSKHAPSDRETILRELRKIASPRCSPTEFFDRWNDKGKEEQEYKENNNSNNNNDNDNNNNEIENDNENDNEIENDNDNENNENDNDNENDNQATEITSGNGNKGVITNIENKPKQQQKQQQKQKQRKTRTKTKPRTKRKQKQKQRNTEPALSTVLVVFDGNEDETQETIAFDPDVRLAWVVTDGTGRRKDRADDWIVHSGIPRLSELLLLPLPLPSQNQIQNEIQNEIQNKNQNEIQNETTTTTTTTTSSCNGNGNGNRNPCLFHHHHRVHLVTADRDLRKRVRATRVMRGGSEVNPPAFWRDYLPVLQKQQREQRQ